jgi:hypothetical protein
MRGDPFPLIIAQHHPIHDHLPFDGLESNFSRVGKPLSNSNVNRP